MINHRLEVFGQESPRLRLLGAAPQPLDERRLEVAELREMQGMAARPLQPGFASRVELGRSLFRRALISTPPAHRLSSIGRSAPRENSTRRLVLVSRSQQSGRPPIRVRGQGLGCAAADADLVSRP